MPEALKLNAVGSGELALPDRQRLRSRRGIELQEIAERVIRREPKKHDLIINVAPGTTKSTIVSQMFPAWVWTRFPQAQFVCGSYAADIATEHSTATRDIILSEKYQRTFPSTAP